MSGEAPAVRDALAVYATEAPETDRVPPGYKRTEVGVIPEDWQIKSLHEFATITAGGTPDRSNPAYWGGNIPWATTAQIDFHEIVSFDQFITEDGLRHSAAKIFPSGTLLMAMYGQGKTRGKVGVLGVDAATNQACAAILLDGTVSHEYVFQCLGSRYKSIRKLSNTGNQENLNGLIIKSIQIPIPSEQEQRAIATALSDVDELISALDKLITKKRAVKTAAMQQLLSGRKRMPGFETIKGYRQTEAGTIPEDWSVVTLGSLFSFKNGLNKSREYFGYGTPIVNYMDVYEHTGIYTTDLQGRVNVDKQELKAFGVRKGDVFFTRTSETVDEIGIAAVVLDNPQETVFSGFVLRARPKNDRLEENFKKYCFASSQVRKQITSKSTYTTRALTNGRVLSAVSIACPPKEEQTAIATVLTDMDAEIAALEARREKTSRIKLGMMQELLTGRTRLV